MQATESIRSFVREPRTRASWISASLVLVLAGAAGCAPEGATDQAVDSTEPLTLFKDPSSSGLRLDVYDFNGQAAIAVSGPIGSEATVPNFKGDESLADIYRAIHPAVQDAPAELTALDQRLAPAFAALRSVPRPAAQSLSGPRIDKSRNSFNSTLCKQFREGSARYTPIECNWSSSTLNVWATQDFSILSGDRTYGWNNNAGESRVMWFYDIPGDQAFAGQMKLPPYWWSWMTIWGGGPYWAFIDSYTTAAHPTHVMGERGVTWHSVSYTVN